MWHDPLVRIVMVHVLEQSEYNMCHLRSFNWLQSDLDLVMMMMIDIGKWPYQDHQVHIYM